jgi:hypothetical protein
MARFSYTMHAGLSSSAMPFLPLVLSLQGQRYEGAGLLDTGAAVNVLPYEVGLMLGAVWEQQTTIVPLVGALGRMEARALLVTATHPQIIGGQTVNLVFAWTQAHDVPIILGQMNFFAEFDVCFYRARNFFEVNLKRSS